MAKAVDIVTYKKTMLHHNISTLACLVDAICIRSNLTDPKIRQMLIFERRVTLSTLVGMVQNSASTASPVTGRET